MKVLLAIALTIFAAGCKTGPDKRITNYTGETFHSDKKGESLETKLNWIKNKEKGVDLNVEITNNYSKPVVIKGWMLTGEVAGVKADTVMPMEKIHLVPKQTYKGIFALRFSSKERSGPGKFMIALAEAKDGDVGKDLKTAVIEFPVNPAK